MSGPVGYPQRDPLNTRGGPIPSAYAAPAFTPAAIASVVYVMDMASSVLKTSGGTVTTNGNPIYTAADARGTGHPTASASVSSGVAATLNTGITFGGRPAMVLASSPATKLATPGGTALNNAPWWIFAVARILTTADYSTLALVGGTSSASNPAQGVLGSLGAQPWVGNIAPQTVGGYGRPRGRNAIDTTAAHAYLARYTGSALEVYVDNIQGTRVDGTTFFTADNAITIGGPAYPGLGSTLAANLFYLAAGYNGAPTKTETNALFAFARTQFGIGVGVNYAVDHGCSIEADYDITAGTGWCDLAVAGATGSTWTRRAYSVFGLGRGSITGANTALDGTNNANGTAEWGNPSNGTTTGTYSNPVVATQAEHSSVWDLSPALSPNNATVEWGTTILTNDNFEGATVAYMEYAVTMQAARCSAQGGIFVPCTMLPRTGSGVPVGFAANRLALNAWILANWNVPIRSGLVDGITTGGVVTTKLPHQFTSADTVHLQLATGNTAANNAPASPWSITVLSPTTFQLVGFSGGATWTGDGVCWATGGGLGGKYWCDFGGIALMQDSTNSSYFLDGTHPTALGHTTMATVRGVGAGCSTPVQVLTAIG